jgi:hypothetical protein
VKFLKSGQFWAGMAVMYVLLMVFPQLSVRSMGLGAKGKVKKGGQKL